MIKFKDLYPLLEKNLIRFECHDCLENHHAQSLAAKGYVKLIETTFDFDDASFDYPFGKVGMQSVTCIEMTPLGVRVLSKLEREDAARFDHYFSSCGSPEKSGYFDKIVFTHEVVHRMLDSGRRDILFDLNSTPANNFMGLQGCDPDTRGLEGYEGPEHLSFDETNSSSSHEE